VTRIAALIIAALAAGYGLHALAQSRFDVRPAMAPIGTSSSNGISFAWFYDPNDRAVYVCRAAGGSEPVDCRPKTQLP
jgi:hypothetical protein